MKKLIDWGLPSSKLSVVILQHVNMAPHVPINNIIPALNLDTPDILSPTMSINNFRGPIVIDCE